jgi:hypothetical protein
VSLRLQAHPSFVSRIERGHRTIDVVEFLDVAKAIGVEPEAMFAAFLEKTRS